MYTLFIRLYRLNVLIVLLLRLLTLLYDMGQVVDAADALELHAGQVLTPPHAHQHDVVLLQIVALPGHIGHHLLARRQAHQHALSVRGVGLLRLLDQRLQDHPLGERLPVEWLTWRPRLNVGPTAVHLVQRGHSS